MTNDTPPTVTLPAQGLLAVADMSHGSPMTCHGSSSSSSEGRAAEQMWRGDPAEIVTGEDRIAALLDRVPAWHQHALCRDFAEDLWFPARGQPSRPALEICGNCTVRLECLADALADKSLDHGIRGGLTAAARIARRRSSEARAS